jgi:predicted Zn-dependent protease
VREDEFYQPPQFPQKITYSKAQQYFEKTAELSPEERAQVVLKIVNQVEQEKIVASGTVVNGDAMLAYGSSAGSFCYDKWTFAHFTLTLTDKNDWTTYYSDSNNNFEELEIDAGVSQALKRLNWEKEPLVLNPGKYTVLLEPTAAKTFLSYLAAMGLGGCYKQEDNIKGKGININRGKKVKLKLATSWPAHFPIMGTGVDSFAKRLFALLNSSL